ncbi:MAG: DUF2812 domain-containing protein [Oscillospiraceae bacterium]|nr:DUF2812 domain-containing protein [Oscillospiraceae bacterium]
MENNTKTEKNTFNLYHYPQLINHLEQQAAEGWMLCDCTETYLEYRSCTPQKVHFAVTFYPDYDFLDTEAPEKLKNLWDFCQLNGWEHITDNATMQVFCNKNENPVPLHTDAVVQMENFHAMMKAADLKQWKQETILNGVVVVFVAVLFAFVRQDGVDLREFVLRISPVMVLVLVHDIWKSVSNGAQWLRYASWHKTAKLLAHSENIFMPPKENKLLKKLDIAVAVAFVAVAIAYMFVDNNLVVAVTGFAVIFTVIICYILVAKLFRAQGVPAEENRILTTLIMVLVLAVVLHIAGGVLIWLADHGIIEPVIRVTTVYK